jgi:muconolactone delta-isomerase
MMNRRVLSALLPVLMLFYVQMRWTYPGSISFEKLMEIEAQEIQHARKTQDNGMVVGIYKVVAEPRVIAIVNVASLEELDRNTHRLPMRDYLEIEKVWALRDYAGFSEDALKAYKP